MRFDAPTLVHMGMNGADLVHAINDAQVQRRGGAVWWCRAFGLTAPLFRSLTVAPHDQLDTRHIETACAALSAALSVV